MILGYKIGVGWDFVQWTPISYGVLVPILASADSHLGYGQMDRCIRFPGFQKVGILDIRNFTFNFYLSIQLYIYIYTHMLQIMMINDLLHCFSISIQAEFIMGKLSFLLSIHTSLQGSGIFNIFLIKSMVTFLCQIYL